MNNPNEIKEVDISHEIGYDPISAADQVRGKWFPDSKVKPGTRWFYILILIVFLCSIISQLVNTIMIIFELSTSA